MFGGEELLGLFLFRFRVGFRFGLLFGFHVLWLDGSSNRVRLRGLLWSGDSGSGLPPVSGDPRLGVGAVLASSPALCFV